MDIKLDDEFIDLNKKCPKCGREIYGYKLLGTDIIEVTCDCVLEERRQNEKRLKEIKKLSHIDELKRSSGLFKVLAEKRFENFEQNRGTERAIKICKKFVTDFEKMKMGMILSGPCGCGKTHLACAVANELLDCNYSVIFYRISDLFEKLKHSYNSKQDENILQSCYKCRLLILDDFGIDNPTVWNKEILHNIIDGRMIRGLPTVITTNLNEKEFNSRLDERTADRMNEGFYYFEINAKSYRKEKNK